MAKNVTRVFTVRLEMDPEIYKWDMAKYIQEAINNYKEQPDTELRDQRIFDAEPCDVLFKVSIND